MMKSTHLVKRHGKTQQYDQRKLYASIYAAALNAHLGEEEAEKVADHITKSVEKSAFKHNTITSSKLRKWTVEALGGEENDIAYLYTHHLDIN